MVDKNSIIAALENRLHTIYDSNWVTGITDDAVAMYNRWPGMDGLVDMYQATANTTHIDRAVEMALQYIEMGKDLNNDGYRDWQSSWLNNHSHDHVEIRAADGIARLAEALHTDASLAVTYKNQAKKILRYLEVDVWEKGEKGRFSNPLFLNNNNVTHFIGRIGVIANALYKITADQKYHFWLNGNGLTLKSSLRLINSAYWWNCHTNGTSCQPGQSTIDTSHAGDTVNFMVESHYNKLHFDAEDMHRLVQTVKTVLWNKDNANPQFNDLLDGTGAYSELGKNQGGWIKLAAFNPELRNLYLTWLQTANIPGDAFIQGQLFGSLAKAYALSDEE